MKKIILINFLLLISAMIINTQEILNPIRNDNLHRVKELVKKNPILVNKRMDMGYTPLFYATENNKIEIAEYLISKGADVDFVLLDDYYGITPMTNGIVKGNFKMVKMLRERGAEIQYRTNLGENYLHFATAGNKVEIAEYLLNCGIGINSVKNGNLTPLHIAAIYGSADVAKLLIKKGANLDLKSCDGGTPLHFAIAARNHEIADILRQGGQKIYQENSLHTKGNTLVRKLPGRNRHHLFPNSSGIYIDHTASRFSLPMAKKFFGMDILCRGQGIIGYGG